MKNRKNIFIVAIVLMLASCASPKLTNNDRGNYQYKKLTNPETIIEVSVSSLPLPDAPKKESEKLKTFFDLRDSIPNSFLKVIGAKATNTKEILDAIKEPLSKVDNQPASGTAANRNILDKNGIKIRLLFTNIKKYYNDKNLLHPNTRLEFLTTRLNLETTDFSIISIDKIENEFEQIDLGSLERTQGVSFNSKLSVEGNLGMTGETSNTNTSTSEGQRKGSNTQNVYDEEGRIIGTTSASRDRASSNTKTSNSKANVSNNVSAKGELEYANKEEIKEAFNIKFKRIKTGFSFTPNNITISQRGMPLNDISDNIVVTATLKVNKTNTKLDTKRVTEFSKLFDAEKKTNPIKDIETKVTYVQYPPCYSNENIKLSVSYSGVIRSVKNQKKGRNVLEYDDKVIYYAFDKAKEGSSSITINKSEFCHDVFKIVAKFGDDTEYTLNMVGVNNDEILVYDEHNPKQILDWLTKLITEKNIDKLKADNKLAFLNIEGEKIYLSKPDFNENDLKELLKVSELGFRIREE
jgi:hypothetical protein